MMENTSSRHHGPAGPDRGCTRSFIAELLLPTNRDFVIRTLIKIEQLISESPNGSPSVPLERESIPRFNDLFAGGELLPMEVFTHALEHKEGESVNGQILKYDHEVLHLRDIMVMQFKPISKELQKHGEVPARVLTDFCVAWFNWEVAWLRNREVHAVQALQPLCNAIISLEPLVMSKKKEKLLPHPQVISQKTISYRCLEGFLHSFSELCAVLLSSLRREMDHDSRLLVLIDYLVRKKESDDESGKLLVGCASTPGILFPDVTGEGVGMDVEKYAVRLGKNTVANFYDKAKFVLTCFDNVVEELFNLQTTLHELDPQLEHHKTLVPACAQFEKAFRQAKKVLLEPANLV